MSLQQKKNWFISHGHRSHFTALYVNKAHLILAVKVSCNSCTDSLFTNFNLVCLAVVASWSDSIIVMKMTIFVKLFSASFWCHFFLFLYVLASHSAFGMSINRKKQKAKAQKWGRKRNTYMNCCAQILLDSPLVFDVPWCWLAGCCCSQATLWLYLGDVSVPQYIIYSSISFH